MKTVHKLIFAFAILTLLILQLYWMYGSTLVYKITPDKFEFLPTNDQVAGGHSTSSMELDGSAAILNCELTKTPDYAWPYCGVSIGMTDKIFEGMNLEHIHTVRLNIDFEQLDSPNSPRMRFYLRNFNSAYSQPDNEYTQKYNGLEYTPGAGSGSVDIPIKNLQVMTWWLVDNSIPIRYSAPEFSNVTKVEFATGSGHYTGQYRMKIHSIELIGDYIATEKLMFSLLLFWISLALIYSAVEIRRSRQVIQHAHFRQDHLRKLNRELKEQNIHFAELANRDALTGAMNRHCIRDWLETNYDNANPKRGKLSALYLDIDHFKSVNDLYGHSMGDDILREFTMVVLSSLSASERLVRWGGEEFVVFCPGLDLEEAQVVAERIRHKVEAHIWIHGDTLTTSIGVATLNDDRPNEMITRADEALYMAKRQGRNQVVVISR